MKTLEFKLDINSKQQAMIDGWLGVQRKVWNRGLALLKQFEQFAFYNKHDKAYAPRCPINWQYRYIPNSEQDGYITVPYCVTGSKRKWGEYQQFCQIPQAYQQPVLDRDSEYSLTPLFAYKLDGNEWLRDSGCPYKLTQGTIKLLATSWVEYRKGKRKSPKFKSDRNPMRSLNDTQSGNAKVLGDWVSLPKLGRLKIKSASRRWPEGLEVKTYRILKRPSGYYLMMVGDVPVKRLKPSDKACGIDPGVVSAVSLDNGREFKPANPLKKSLKKLKRLQRKASRQQQDSNGQKRTYDQIAVLSEEVSRSRSAFNHKVSTKTVREYGAIAFENTNIQNMTRRPKPQLREDGKGYKQNKAKAKAGLNRALLDVAIGDLRSKIEAKCKTHGRDFDKPPAQNSSQLCHCCKQKGDRRTQSEFVCLNGECNLFGQIQNADENAARNHLLNASFYGRYRAWAWELKREETVISPSTGTTGNSETVEHRSVPPEAGLPAPSHELLAPTLNQTLTRESPDGGSQNPCNFIPKKPRKSRSAQSLPAIGSQLSLWDLAGETNLGSG